MAIEDKDSLRSAFFKVKHDIYSLYSQITSLKREVSSMSAELAKVSEILSSLSSIVQNLSANQKQLEKASKIQEVSPPLPAKLHPTENLENPLDSPVFSNTPTHLPTHFPYFNKEKKQISTGNEGVPTDRQTDQQTDNTSPKGLFSPSKLGNSPEKMAHLPNPIEDAVRALDSLDSLKKEIRLKFKQLTDQEVLIFSTLYQMEQEGPVDYKTLALKLGLTESSIRDYIGRLLQKGIPVEKQKINNKKILLSISPGLKRVASLQTILQLRDL